MQSATGTATGEMAQAFAAFREGRDVSVRMSFGGNAVQYAVSVHENLEAFHRVGQAKFLESVLNESVGYMTQRVAARMRL